MININFLAQFLTHVKHSINESYTCGFAVSCFLITLWLSVINVFIFLFSCVFPESRYFKFLFFFNHTVWENSSKTTVLTTIYMLLPAKCLLSLQTSLLMFKSAYWIYPIGCPTGIVSRTLLKSFLCSCLYLLTIAPLQAFLISRNCIKCPQLYKLET